MRASIILDAIVRPLLVQQVFLHYSMAGGKSVVNDRCLMIDSSTEGYALMRCCDSIVWFFFSSPCVRHSASLPRPRSIAHYKHSMYETTADVF